MNQVFITPPLSGDPKVSVIVPVYNLRKYLARCFDSLCGQTLRDIEIILVDDGSTDGSLKVCRDYQGRDERVRVISKENGGTTAARKTGFELARGEYVAFCDCDEYMPTTALLDLYDAA